MIPGLDFQAFGRGARERAQAVYDALARRYERLARQARKDGEVVPSLARGPRARLGQRKGAAPARPSFARLAEPQQSSRDLRDIEREAYWNARREQNARLAELFKLAMTRAGGVDFACKLLSEGLKTRHIKAALQTLPEGTHRSGDRGFAARIAARDALASGAPTISTPSEERVAALKAAYAKATGP